MWNWLYLYSLKQAASYRREFHTGLSRYRYFYHHRCWYWLTVRRGWSLLKMQIMFLYSHHCIFRIHSHLIHPNVEHLYLFMKRNYFQSWWYWIRLTLFWQWLPSLNYLYFQMNFFVCSGEYFQYLQYRCQVPTQYHLYRRWFHIWFHFTKHLEHGDYIDTYHMVLKKRYIFR